MRVLMALVAFAVVTALNLLWWWWPNRPVEIAGWAGPWPADERWWDPPAASSRARFQLVGTDGTAWLVTRDRTGWHLEATYD